MVVGITLNNPRQQRQQAGWTSLHSAAAGRVMCKL